MDIRSLVSIDDSVGMIVHVAKKFCKPERAKISRGTAVDGSGEITHKSCRSSVSISDSSHPTQP
jgi:hypothetical protein